MLERIKWSLVKLPDDLGVFHVGGKTGARLGPESFQFCFNKFRGKFDALKTLDKEWTLGEFTGNIREHLDSATELVKKAHLTSPNVVVIGGGHDFGYAQVRGIAQANPEKSIGCINLDAHFDLRPPDPEISSGSPFYLLIEEGILDPKHLVEFGIQPHCNAEALWSYAERKGIHIERLAKTRKEGAIACFERRLKELSGTVDLIVLSLDLDCLAEAYAPGVSAPQAEGFTTEEVFSMIRIAANEPKVTSLGIFELNPLYDRNLQTARVAAKAAHTFLLEKSGGEK
jgi:formiminoglutamase